jgi:phage gp46-like protein
MNDEYEKDWGKPIPKQQSMPNNIGNTAEQDWSGNGNNKPMVDTLIGKLDPNGYKIDRSPEAINDMVMTAAGAPGMKVLGTFGRGIKSALTKINPKELLAEVQGGHDKLMQHSSDIYNFVKDEVKPRGVGKIDVKPEILDEAYQHLPKTRANQKLIESAKTGDYDALHQLQSDLGKQGRQASASDSFAERNLGQEIHDTRNKINESIIERFKDYGHEDLAKLLEEAKGKYKKMKELYYSHPRIAQLVEKGLRKEPANAMNMFSEVSDPMKAILQEHPNIGNALETQRTAKDFFNKLKLAKKGAIGLGATGIGVSGSKTLIDMLTGK